MAQDDVAEFTYYRGRVGLAAILEALGVSSGDDVITQAFTCVAVPEAIMAAGARPVYADIEHHGFNLNPDSVEALVTNRTRAIIVQHTFGLPARMPELLNIADRYEIPIIEDCCHTIAGRLNGRPLGSFGLASFFSYEWGKPLVVGVGGSVRANEASLVEALRRQRPKYSTPSIVKQARLGAQFVAFALVYHPRLYWPVRELFHRLSALGAAEGNYKPISSTAPNPDFRLDMAPVQRALLRTRRKRISEDSRHRRHVASRYQAFLTDSIEGPRVQGDADIVYCRFPLIVSDKSRLLASARSAGIELAEWYATPIHPLRGEELESLGYRAGQCVEAETRCDSVVSLPTHRKVSDAYIDRVGSFLSEVSS